MKDGDFMKEKDELRDIIKANLIDLRTKKNLTQSKLAKLVGKSANAVASWEQGLSLPDITTLYNLSKFYRVKMEYFYEDHSEEEVKAPEEPIIASSETSRILDPEKYFMDLYPEPVIIKTGDQYFELDVKALRRYQERKRKKNTDDRYSEVRKVLFDKLSEQNHHEEEG